MTGIAAADRRFEIQCRAAVLRRRLASCAPCLAISALLAVTTALPALQRGLDRRKRRLARPAHQFDEAIDLGIACKRQRIAHPANAAQIDAALLPLWSAPSTATTRMPRPLRARQLARLRLDHAHDLGPDGAKSRYSHLERRNHAS